MAKLKQTVMFAGIVRPFSAPQGETREPDVNGKFPRVIEPIAGESPRGINVISGTVAESQGLENGKVYYFKGVHTGEVESTVNEGKMIEGFNISSIGESNPREAMQWYKEEGLSFLIQPVNDSETQAVASANTAPADVEEEEKDMPSA